MAARGDDVTARGDGPPHGAGGAGGLRAADELPTGPARSRRWLARLAFAAAIAAVVVPLLFGGLKGIAALLLGLLGLAVGCAAAWWFLAYRGVVRWLAFALLVAAPVFVIVVYIVDRLVWEVALGVVLAAAAVAAGRTALAGGHTPAGPPEYGMRRPHGGLSRGRRPRDSPDHLKRARTYCPGPASSSAISASATMISKPRALRILPPATTTLGVPTTGATPIMTAWMSSAVIPLSAAAPALAR
jgi:hypothetical protein